MQQLTIPRICTYDIAFREEIMDLLPHLRLETIRHQDNLKRVCNLADLIRVSRGELSSYIYLQTYINTLRTTCDDVPDQKMVAQQLGLEVADLELYIDKRVAVLERLLAVAY